ncbi:L-type lectin-domain containing receptor kinase IV.1-like [Telopea speciosissima]|uniref:L-type lectin-domain containing receptor kinase IV.1-like n=1 Tax=Telopea speciosissima TaxID=54955 RepID=UPI001CC51AE8|nr:L-type lectin-domain containing receptor kinase IV.1-like [Telopea speciosissima]
MNRRKDEEQVKKNTAKLRYQCVSIKEGLRFQNPDAMIFIFKLTILFLFARIEASSSSSASSSQVEEGDFTYNGFTGANVSLDGMAQITSNGLIMLTKAINREQQGHAFYTNPIRFFDPSSSGGAAASLSFSATYVFAIVSQYSVLSGHGIAFVISPTRGFPGALPSEYLGLFNSTDIGNSTNHVFAVELDTVESKEFNDINDNHVGIDIDGLISVASAPASYFDNDGRLQNLSLVSGRSMQVWVDYDGVQKHLNVTLAPINVPKPAIPLLSLSRDLSPVMKESMFVGFSSSTGSVPTNHFVLGWSFKVNGQANELNLSQLPKLPVTGQPNQKPAILTIGLPVLVIGLMSATIYLILIMVKRKRKFAEVVEEWELDYGPHRFKYKDLYIATNGFKHQGLLGSGGFGRVYRGVLPTSKIEVAVKKISHDSRQGMKEFVAEIVSVGRLRHRNLVTLLGYCRREGELLLVYEFMPNGSLDKFLFDPLTPVLNWGQRFRIIRGIASALFYLHEEWEQVVVHRDVKSSNVLLDGELNGRLGDFGLATLYNRESEPQTTHVVGTLGYLAPELSRTGKANPNTDVFAFGAFILEVACGRRPVEPRASADQDLVLVDWVFSCWSRGTILETVDPNLMNNYVEKEMELVLKLGLLCSNCIPTERPTMRQVVQYLDGELPLPDLSSLSLIANGISFTNVGFDAFVMSYPSSLEKISTLSPTVSESLLSGRISGVVSGGFSGVLSGGR